MAGFLRPTWHAAPRHVIGNLRFTDRGVFAEYLLSATDFFYLDEDSQRDVATDHNLLYRHLPQRCTLSGLTAYRSVDDICRGMAVAGLPLAAREQYLAGRVDVPDISTCSTEWLSAIRTQWAPHFSAFGLRYRQPWLSVRLDFGRDGSSLLKSLKTRAAAPDYDDPAMIERYQRMSREIFDMIPSVFDPQPAAAQHIWWHWNATTSRGAWREPIPDVDPDPFAVLDESAFTPAYLDENAAELYGPDGVSADNPLVRVYRDPRDGIDDTYQAIAAVDNYPAGGLVFPRSMLFKLADDLSTPTIIIDWHEDLQLRPADKVHAEMIRMDRNLNDQWRQRGDVAGIDDELPRQKFLSRELATKCSAGSSVRAGSTAIWFSVAAGSPEEVAAGVKTLTSGLSKAAVEMTRWRGAQKSHLHVFIPGCEVISGVKNHRHPTTSDDLGALVPMVSSQLGDPFGVPLGLDITMPGMRDVGLCDVLGAPTRDKGAVLVAGGDPGRGKSTVVKTLEYSWAEIGARLGIIDPTQVREHERALAGVGDEDHRKLVIDAHRNLYSLDCVRLARRNADIIADLQRQGRSDIDEELLPQPTDHLLALLGVGADSAAGRRFQKLVAPRYLAANDIGDTHALINFLRDLPARDKTAADEQLLIGLEGLSADRHLRALFDRTLEVPDFNAYQIVIWNTAWLELPTSEETAAAHLHSEITPRQRAGRAIYGLAIDSTLQMFFSRPKEPAQLVVEECYDWIHSDAGAAAAYKLMTQGRKVNSGMTAVVQNPVKTFDRIGSEFITQRLLFGFKSSKMAQAALQWCDRDIERHPDLLRDYVKNTSPVIRGSRRNRRTARQHGRVIPGREGEAWWLDEIGNFGKIRAFTHPNPKVQAQFDTNPLTWTEAS